MAEKSKIRVDKWLWAVRIFKTRSLATDACNAGRVKIEGKSVKPSRTLRIGETVTVKKGQLTIIYKAVGLIQKRVSATLAAENYEDLSPPPPPPKPTKFNSAFIELPVAQRERGAGRPTKRERRKIDDLKDNWWDDLDLEEM